MKDWKEKAVGKRKGKRTLVRGCTMWWPCVDLFVSQDGSLILVSNRECLNRLITQLILTLALVPRVLLALLPDFSPIDDCTCLWPMDPDAVATHIPST